MQIARIALLAAGTLLSTPLAWSTEGEAQGKPYLCGDELMTLRKLENGHLELKWKIHTGYVYVQPDKGMFMGRTTERWAILLKTPQAALDATCREILERSNLPSKQALQKELDEFYESLK